MEERFEGRLETLAAELAFAQKRIADLEKAESEITPVGGSSKQVRRAWETIFNSLTDLVSIQDKEFRIISANKAYAAALSMKPEDLVGKHCYDYGGPDRAKHLKFILTETKEAKKPASVEFYERGQGKYFEISTSPVLSDDGEFDGLVLMIKDVTQKRRAEEEMLELSRAVEQSPNIIIITDTKGSIEYVNPKFTQLTGYLSDEVVGSTPRILRANEMPGEEYRRLWDIITSGGEWKGEFHNKKKNGELYWEYVSISAIRNAKGSMAHFLIIEQDITQRKELDRMKDEFISTVSHELRTPLTTIKEGVAQMLEGILGVTTESQREVMSIVLSDIDRLKRIIDSLLDISKLEYGKVKMNMETVDMASIAEGVSAAFYPSATSKGLKLKTNFPKGPVVAYADRDKIVQVLTNLVNNAIKFTDKGYVEIAVTETQQEVECSVFDTGKGIEEKDVPRVFAKFQQFGRQMGPGEKGTGLGLSIAKGIIDLHKGKIWVKSSLGQGTTFIFRVPKYATSESFKDYLIERMEEAKKNEWPLSVLLFYVRDYEEVRRRIGNEHVVSLMESIENFIKANLRRQEDRTFVTDRSVLVVLTTTGEKDAFTVAGRIKGELDDYLSDERFGAPVEALYRIAQFPKNGKTCDELMKCLEEG